MVISCGMTCAATGYEGDNPNWGQMSGPSTITIEGVCPPERRSSFLEPGQRLWRQLFIPEVLCIPEMKPDIEQLISVHVDVELLDQRVIRTPALTLLRDNTDDISVTSEEGLVLTGRKLVILGMLRQKVIYVASNAVQSVHAAHFDVPFATFIVLPPYTPLTTHYRLETCIEDVFLCGCYPRQIFKNVTLMIKATPLICP